MNLNGRIDGCYFDAFSGEMKLTLAIRDREALVNGYDALKGQELAITLDKPKKRRSRDANAMLWACLGEIAADQGADKWDIYLLMLRRYGKYTYILVPEKAVEDVKKQWRECEVIGEVNVNGRKSIQMLCYFGSSMLDSKEFSRLLNGVVSEMSEMGLPTPPSREMREALERLEKNEVNHTT